ncbi:transposase zinc-binding domain-containing protein, partial [Spirochaetota bacterium]
MYITSEIQQEKRYTPGLERFSLYKDIWIHHWQGFQKIYDNTYSALYGSFNNTKILEVKKLIRCGKFSNGFTRHSCPECGTILIIPFTCKSRLCLSCYRKRLFGWSINLSQIINPTLHHYHITLTIPGGVSKLLFNRNYHPEKMIKLSSKLYIKELRKIAGYKQSEFQPGLIATLHKCGNSLNYNPHVHIVATREMVNRHTGEIKDISYI